jgi:exodeoxyribonuclease VII large subunit
MKSFVTQSNDSTQRAVYSVSAVTKVIKENLEREFPALWVEGEISNYSRHSSGHSYFTLKDDTAQISVVLFRSFNHQVPFELADGQQVLIFGHISVYEKRGSYQLYAEVIEPRGLGALQLAFEQLKQKLHKEGLFDESHKKPIPVLPRCIGIVTSPTGAAIRDMLQILNRRFSNLRIILNPVKVQGDGAAREIAQAIEELNAYGACDVIIVGRGGGSLEDLWAFNEEVVARAIYASKTPIVSAVGHEVDYTISDFVADLRAPTPSAAAELVVTRKEDWQEKIANLEEDLLRTLQRSVGEARMHFEQLESSYAFRQPKELLAQYSQRVDEFTRSLTQALKGVVQEGKHRFTVLMGKLDALSPLAILARGYSLSFIEKESVWQLLQDVSLLTEGNVVRTKLHKGTYDARVLTIHNDAPGEHDGVTEG